MKDLSRGITGTDLSFKTNHSTYYVENGLGWDKARLGDRDCGRDSSRDTSCVQSPQLDHDLQVRCEEEWSLDFRPKWMVPFPKIETTEGDFEKRRGVLTTLWGEAPVRTPTQNALQAANTGMDVDMDGWMEMVSISLF